MFGMTQNMYEINYNGKIYNILAITRSEAHRKAKKMYEEENQLKK